MRQEDTILGASPAIFLIRVVFIEFFFALVPLALAILLNLRSEYETYTIAFSNLTNPKSYTTCNCVQFRAIWHVALHYGIIVPIT